LARVWLLALPVSLKPSGINAWRSAHQRFAECGSVTFRTMWLCPGGVPAQVGTGFPEVQKDLREAASVSVYATVM